MRVPSRLLSLLSLSSLSLALVLSCGHLREVEEPVAGPDLPSPGSDPIGSIVGQASVGFTGAASYTMALPVPPGIAGHQPSLSLTYNSQAGNGVLGHGGLLTGFSAVTRCTVRRDGVAYPVRYASSDRFCLDGQLLVLASGSYGADGASYRTERDTFVELRSHGSCGAGPCSFSARTPKGEAREYGDEVAVEAVPDPSAASVLPSGSVRVWPISSWSDRDANTVSYSYDEDEDTGEYMPHAIAYTSNATASPAQQAQRALTLRYIDKPAATTLFQAGAQVRHSKLLSEVVTCVSSSSIVDCDDPGAERVRTRSLAYLRSAFTGHARLREVSDLGADDTPLPPTRFAWQQPSSSAFADPTSWATDFTASTGWDIENQPRVMADLDADGRTDLVGFGKDLSFSLSTGSGFGATQSADSSLTGCDAGHDCLGDYPRVMGDVDGDGRVDAIAFEHNNVYTLRFDGSNFQAPEPWTQALTISQGWSSTTQRTAADLDGDGLTDIIGFGMFSTEFYYSDGEAAFVARAQHTMADFSANDGFSASQGNAPVLADVNGDGATDIVGMSGDEIWVGLSTGDGFAPRVLWTQAFSPGTGADWNPNTAPCRVADVNGDGLPDVVGFRNTDVIVAYSTGVSFTDPVVWDDDTFAGWDDSQGSQRVLADVNGDGRADIVGFSAEGVEFGVARGFDVIGEVKSTSFETDVISGPSGGFAFGPLPQNPRFPMATTGEGIAALIIFGDENVLVSTPPTDTAEVVIDITDGIGGSTRWSYASLSSPSADDWYSSAPAVPELPVYREFRAPVTVVTKVEHGDGVGGVYTYDQHWTGAVARIDESGFLGFQSHTVIDRQFNTDAAEPGQSTTTAFVHSFLDDEGEPLIDTSVPAGETIARTADGFVLYSSSATVVATPTLGGAAFVHPEDETVHSFSTASAGEVTRHKTFSFDAWGNHRLIHDEGDIADPNDDLDTCVTYQVDTQAWTLAFPDSVRQTHGACTLEGDSCACPSEPGSPLVKLVYTSDGRLDPYQLRAWDDQHDSWMGSEWRYDAFGQVLRSSKKAWTGDGDVEGQTLTWTEQSYDSIWQTFPTTLTNALYSTQASYDPGSGEVLSTRDQNGVERSATLDGFGRVVSTLGPAADGSGSVRLSHHRWGRDELGWFSEVRTLHDWAGDERVVRRHFDGLGRTVRTAMTGSEGATIVRELAYVDLARLDRHGLSRFATDPSEWVTHTYDSVGRLSRLEFPTGDAVELDYDIVEVDGLARQTATSRTWASDSSLVRTVTSYSDASGQVVRRDLPAIEGRPAPIVRFERDAFARLSTLSAPDGTSTSLSYDSLGRHHSATSTVRGTTTWAWTALGTELSVSSATGDTVTHSYGPLLRETQRVLSTAGGGARTMTFTYDDSSPGQFGVGRLASVDDSAQGGMSTGYAYDAYGNITGTTRMIDGYNFATNSAFSPVGQRVWTGFPSGAAARWRYGVTGVLEQLDYCATSSDCAAETYEAIGSWSQFTASGKPQVASLGGGALSESRTYDVLGRPHTTSAATDAGTMIDETTTWATLYEIESIDDQIDDAYDRAFTYFATGAVETAQIGPRSYTFDYDAGGSLTHSIAEGDETRFTVDNQQISSITSPGRSDGTGYHADGALHWVGSAAGADDSWTFAYDPAGTLVSARGPGPDGAVIEESYLDDHAGWQLRRERGDGAVIYDLSPSLQVTILSSGEAIETHSLRGPNSVVGTVSVARSPDDAQAQPQLADATGTGLVPGPNGPGIPVAGQTLLFSNDLTHGTQLVVDPSNPSLGARLTYAPYGDVSAQSTGVDTFMAKFDGYAQAPDSGLVAMGGRALWPNLARFTAADSHLIGAPEYTPAAYNAYAFGANNWASQIDPSGHGIRSICVDVGIAVTLTATAIAAPELLPGEVAVGLAVGTGAYTGAAAVNQSYNPVKWRYNSWQTYAGMAAGAALSAGGQAFDAAVPAATSEWSAGARFLAGVAVDTAYGAASNVAFAAMGGARGEQLTSAAWQGAAIGAASSIASNGAKLAKGTKPPELMDPDAAAPELRDASSDDVGASGHADASGGIEQGSSSAELEPETTLPAFSSVEPAAPAPVEISSQVYMGQDASVIMESGPYTPDRVPQEHEAWHVAQHSSGPASPNPGTGVPRTDSIGLHRASGSSAPIREAAR